MDDDAAFRQQLERRISAYRLREQSLAEQVLEVQAELGDVARRRESAERLYEAEFGAPLPMEVASDAQARRPEEHIEPEPGPLTGLSWGDAIVRVLDEHGPAHIKEIWRLLAEGGFRTDARDPLRSIVAIALRLDPAVFRIAPNTYALGNGRPVARSGQQVLATTGGEGG